MTFDFHSRYCALMRKVYGPAVPLPSSEQWTAMCAEPRKPSEGDFDFETEQRDGWAYQQHEEHFHE